MQEKTQHLPINVIFVVNFTLSIGHIVTSFYNVGMYIISNWEITWFMLVGILNNHNMYIIIVNFWFVALVLKFVNTLMAVNF